jgi:alkylhydroperoxidase family enzyme
MARLKLRSSTDTGGDVQRILEKLERGGSVNAVSRLLANAEHGFRPYVLMSDALLFRATLPPEVREVVILRMASALGIAYELAEHRRFAERAGVSQERQEAAIGDDWRTAVAWSEPERLALDVATDLLDGSALDIGRWTQLCEEFGEPGALDLLLTIGWWGGFMPLVLRGLDGHQAELGG